MLPKHLDEKVAELHLNKWALNYLISIKIKLIILEFPKKDLLSQIIIDIRNEKIKVGIIGNGFVGEAQAFAFSSVADVYILILTH